MSAKKSTTKMYIGNTFTIKNGKGIVSPLKYVLVKKGHSYLAVPGDFKVLVGSYELTKKDEGIPFLINGVRLDKQIGRRRISTQEIVKILIESNDPRELKKVL